MNIHISFIAVIFLAVLSGYAKQFFLFFLFVTIHELAHIICAVSLGLRIDKLVITPFGETAVIKNMTQARFAKKLMVISAGPLTSLFLYIICLIFRIQYSANINLAVFLFNFLPAYPLDGGRLLHSALCCFFGTLEANKFVIKISNFFLNIILGCGLIQAVLYPFNFSLILIGLFLKYMGRKEYMGMFFDFYKRISDYQRKDVRRVKLYSAGLPISTGKLCYKLSEQRDTVFLLYRGRELEKIIHEAEIIELILEEGLMSVIE